jgi:endonuclease YncB( thermonuclease family)
MHSRSALGGKLLWGAIVAVGLFSVYPSGASGGAYRVLSVVRGDRIVVDFKGKPEEVKLLRVEIPDLEGQSGSPGDALGEVAAAFTRQRLAGKLIDLEFEGPLRGRSCRLRAYVLVDGTNLNIELVRHGFSPYITRRGTSAKYDDAFSAAEIRARKNRLRIWADPELAAHYLKLKSDWQSTKVNLMLLLQMIRLKNGNI